MRFINFNNNQLHSFKWETNLLGIRYSTFGKDKRLGTDNFAEFTEIEF